MVIFICTFFFHLLISLLSRNENQKNKQPWLCITYYINIYHLPITICLFLPITISLKNSTTRWFYVSDKTVPYMECRTIFFYVGSHLSSVLHSIWKREPMHLRALPLLKFSYIFAYKIAKLSLFMTWVREISIIRRCSWQITKLQTVTTT
jgi:hypothetical protein